MNAKLAVKLKVIKEIFDEFSNQLELYSQVEEKLKESLLFASQKKTEELIEFSIKINKELLKSKKISPLSYKESFLELKSFDNDSKIFEEMAIFASFRNRLAHDYINISNDESLEQMLKVKEIFPKYLKKIHKICESIN